MFTWISKKQSLLNSDQEYLDKKMQLVHKKTTNKKRIRSIQSTYSSKIIDLEEDFKQTTPYSIKHVRQLKSELVLAKKTISHLQLDIATLKGTIQQLNLQNKKSTPKVLIKILIKFDIKFNDYYSYLIFE